MGGRWLRKEEREALKLRIISSAKQFCTMSQIVARTGADSRYIKKVLQAENIVIAKETSIESVRRAIVHYVKREGLEENPRY